MLVLTTMEGSGRGGCGGWLLRRCSAGAAVGRWRLVALVVVVAVGACSGGGRLGVAADTAPGAGGGPGSGAVGDVDGDQGSVGSGGGSEDAKVVGGGQGSVGSGGGSGGSNGSGSGGGGRVYKLYYGLGRATAPGGVFVDVSASAYSTCGARAAGGLECWGNGFAGLPAGETFFAGETFVQLSVTEGSRGSHGCALGADGAVLCWGDDRFGQASPPQGEFVQVSVDADLSCAVDAEAALVCWGRWLGDLPEGEFVQVYAGSPSCALDTGGELVCWGGVERRSLPDAPAGSFSMVSVAAGPGSGLGFGADYACGLRTSGEIACWAASFGQGSNFGQADPPEGSFVSVSAGAEHACAIDTEGRAVCWGNNDTGQVDPLANELAYWRVANTGCGIDPEDWHFPQGPVDCRIHRGIRDGIGINEEITAEHPRWGSEEFWGVYGGVADPLRGPFVQVSVGGRDSCGVRADAAVVCWPGMVGFEVLEGSFSGVALGVRHGCALRVDSTVVCWGVGSDDEDWRNQTEAPAGEFTRIAAGDNHTCGLRTDGSVVCWGKGNVGQSDAPSGEFVEVSAVGDSSCGLRADRTAVCWGRPAMLAPDGEFVSVSAAGRWGRPCGVRPDASIVCWGYGTSGEPPAAAGPLVSASVGPRSSCGVRTDGSVVCWDTHTKEVSGVLAGEFVQAAVLTSGAFCTLDADAAVRCQVRDPILDEGLPVDEWTPVGEFTKVAAGEEHACAIRVDATVVCWGSDAEVASLLPNPDE